MTGEDIRKHFVLFPADGKTLTARLESAVERFIENNSDGTLLPPEEQLAKELGVSRVTVRNALKKFLAEGRIRRKARQGTRICKEISEKQFEIDPLALEHLYLPRPKRPLRFLNFETLPLQQAYWKKVCAAFNERGGSRVEMICLDSSMPVWKLSKILQEQNIDLFLHSFTFPETLSALASPLPENLRQMAGSRDFMPLFDSFRQESMYDYLLPLNLSMLVQVWNKDLERASGLDLETLLKENKLMDVFKKAARQLPPDVYAAGHAWDIIPQSGCPAAERELIHLETKIAQLADLLSLPNAAITQTERGSRDLITDFYNRKILFFEGPRTNLYALGPLPFELREKPLFPDPGCKNLLMTLNMAVSRFSSRKAEAAEFMAYLLSDEAQALCGSVKKAPPLRKKNFFDFMKQEFDFDKELSLKWLQQHELFIDPARRKESFLGFLTFESRKEIQLLARKKISVQEAFERIREKYLQPEYLRVSSGV